MWFIGVEVEQEKSAPPPKKILDPPLKTLFFSPYDVKDANAVHVNVFLCYIFQKG